jgi:hypothetical protein
MALTRPEISRHQVVEAIEFLSRPMVGAELKELRRAFRTWQKNRDLGGLLLSVGGLCDQRGSESMRNASANGELKEAKGPLTEREELRLICVQLITG